MKLSRIAYEGPHFTIEWYFSEKGESQPLNFYNDLTLERKRQVMKLFKLMGEQGKIFDRTKFNYEEDGIYAFKPQPDRFLCFFYRGKKIIVTNAFTKKKPKLPKEDKERALRNLKTTRIELRKKHTMKNKLKSSYDELMNNEEQRKLFEEEYKDLLISELLLAAWRRSRVRESFSRSGWRIAHDYSRIKIR